MDSAHKYSFSSVHCEIGSVAILVQLSQITEVMAFAFCTKGEGSINLEGCIVASPASRGLSASTPTLIHFGSPATPR